MDKGEHYRFFQHRECEYFPCHAGIAQEDFNCLFCFCPLYALGRRCGGSFRYAGGVKDCSACAFPHRRESYARIVGRFDEIAAVCTRSDAGETAPEH